MTALSIDEELMRLTAAAIWAQRGNIVQCVVLQQMPDWNPKVGELAHGEAPIWPFWSVSCVLPAKNNEYDGFGPLARMSRTVTAVLVAGKMNVEANVWLFKQHQQKVFRALNKNRFELGHFESDPASCLRYGIVRPRSPVEQSHWFREQKFSAAIDIEFSTQESPTP